MATNEELEQRIEALEATLGTRENFAKIVAEFYGRFEALEKDVKVVESNHNTLAQMYFDLRDPHNALCDVVQHVLRKLESRSSWDVEMFSILSKARIPREQTQQHVEPKRAQPILSKEEIDYLVAATGGDSEAQDGTKEEDASQDQNDVDLDRHSMADSGADADDANIDSIDAQLKALREQGEFLFHINHSSTDFTDEELESNLEQLLEEGVRPILEQWAQQLALANEVLTKMKADTVFGESSILSQGQIEVARDVPTQQHVDDAIIELKTAQSNCSPHIKAECIGRALALLEAQDDVDNGIVGSGDGGVDDLGDMADDNGVDAQEVEGCRPRVDGGGAETIDAKLSALRKEAFELTVNDLNIESGEMTTVYVFTKENAWELDQCLEMVVRPYFEEYEAQIVENINKRLAENGALHTRATQAEAKLKEERQVREKAEAVRDKAVRVAQSNFDQCKKLQAQVAAMRECVEVLEDWDKQVVKGFLHSGWTIKRVEALAKLKECEG